MKQFTVTLTEDQLRSLLSASRDAYVAADAYAPIDQAYDKLLASLHSDDYVEIDQ